MTESEAAQAVQDAKASVNKGVTLYEAGRVEESLAAYDEVVRRYGERPEAALAELVASALYNKGVTLYEGVTIYESRQNNETLAAYDEVVRRYGERPEAALQELVAKALMNKGLTLAMTGQTKGELAAYDEVVRRCGERPEAALQVLVASALVNKGFTLPIIGQKKESLAAYEEVVRRYGERPEAALQELVAKALVNKGVMLHEARQKKESLAAYEEVVRRYGKRPEAALQEEVAKALYNKGFVLVEAGCTEEAIAAWDELLSRYGERQEATLRELVAKGLFKKGVTLYEAGQTVAAVAPLIEALGQNSADVRTSAARYLRKNRTVGTQAVDALIHALSDQNAPVRAAAWQALTKIADGSSVQSLLARAVQRDADFGSDIQAESIIKNLGAVARPQLLRIVGETSRPDTERHKALNLVADIGLDPELSVPVLIRLFKTEEGDKLRDRAVQLAVQAGLHAVPRLVAALDDEDEQVVRSAAVALTGLADLAERPGERLLAALAPAVPKLEGLYLKFHKSAELADVFLGALLDFAEILPEADEVVEILLAKGGAKAHFGRAELFERRKRRRYRLEQTESDTPPRKESSLTARVEESNETKQPSFVEQEQRRRGRRKQQRPPISWQEIEQFVEKTAGIQADLVKNFKDLLDNLAGTEGRSPEENKVLANTINTLARCLGCDLTHDSRTVDVRFYSRAFHARATDTDRESLVSSAGFPHLTARAIRPAEGVDLAAWLKRELAKVKPRSGGIGNPS